jgi:integrase
MRRYEEQGKPTEGWVFPSGSKCGHYNQGSTKKHYAKALKDSGVKEFEPYTARHTALTNLGKCCDLFTLARIAGHSSIVITQRYVHPQADAIERAFQNMKLVTDGGHREVFAEEAREL